MKNLYLFLFLISVSFGFSQNISNNETSERVPENVRIDATLFDLGQLAMQNLTAAEDKSESIGLRTREVNNSSKLINVEIVYKNNYLDSLILDEINTSYLESLGFKPETVWRNRASLWLSPNEIIEKGSRLSSDYFMFAVRKIIHDNEGPTNTNSSTYSPNAGSGRRIAIIDAGFGNLDDAVAGGHCPTPAYMWRNGSVVTTLASMSAGSVHGTACVEAAFDHAPNATFEVYDVGNPTEVGAAVTLCKSRGVDVISMSLSYYNLGWFDNTGAACVAANDAGNNGILFFTSCGNRANTHWEGNFSDSDADNWHNWSGSDERNDRTAAAGDFISVRLAWNPVVNSDYDVYIYRSSDNFVLASSTNSGTTFEDCSWTNSTGSPVNIYIAVRRIGTASPVFEIFSHDDGNDYEYAVAAGSNTSPSNSTNLNVISVGAVPRTSYANPNGTTGIIASYSSQGPTNSGNLAPKISGPTNTTTFAYSGAFGGTSAATPNAAGAAAAFWSKHSYLDATGVRQILFKMADMYRDWGANGADNIYGNGGIYLADYVAFSRFMWRSANNTTGLSTRAFYTFAQAQASTPNNYTVLILGGIYPENLILGSGTGANKRIFYKSLVSNAFGGL